MKIIEIKTQAEFDALPKEFAEYTEISVIGNLSLINISRTNSYIVLYGNATVQYVCDNATVQDVRDNATVQYVCDNATVQNVYGNATVRNVYGNATVRVYRDTVTIGGLFFWSTLIMMFCTCKVLKKSKTAKIVKHIKTKIDNTAFCETLEKSGNGFILYKSVNPDTLCDFQTGKIKYQGITTCPDFDPNTERECGGGLHLSPTPAMALSYNKGKLLKCCVLKKDMVIFQGNFTKVRCRKVQVLEEVK